MHLINLLPKERIRAFRREYFVRLGALTLALLALIVIIHGVLLFPSYLALSGARAAKEGELSRATAELANSSGADVNARLASLKSNADYLSGLSDVPTGSAAVRAMLSAPRTGIRITALSFTPPSGKGEKDGKMTVSGVAATREALRAYNLALSSLPFVTSADLPINAYAEEADINFEVTLTGTMTP
jgi:hypothetical protein